MAARLLFFVRILVTVFSFFAVACEAAPIAVWDFGTEEATPLKMHGNVWRDQAGPRPPEFPDFPSDNTAVRFDGGGYFSIGDLGSGSEYDFSNGDAITLEAWVKVDQPRDGSPMYIIGKGRTGSPRFARDNQNWALRVVSLNDTVRASFLFATELQQGNSHWHRWTTDIGFQASTGWHHLAVAYEFGRPKSIRAWIDGQPVSGKWDMGGATTEPPVVDDDAIWMGASHGGSQANSFHGLVDRVAIHRTILDDDTVASRFSRVGGPRTLAPQPELMPDMSDLPIDRVLVTFSEGAPSESRWPLEGEMWPAETSRWLGNEFLLPRVPIRFDDWGIRESWKEPLLIRMAADVELPLGTIRFLVRTRSLSRLWVDGELVVKTQAGRRRSGNLEPIVAVPVQPVPGARVAQFVQQEATGEFEVVSAESASSRRVRVVFEFMVGGKGLRTECGEVCVAVQSKHDEWYSVLRPDYDSPLPLTDDAVLQALDQIEKSLGAFEDRTRRKAATSQDPFWERRHRTARDFAAVEAQSHDADQLASADRSVDALIGKKIRNAVADAKTYDQETTRNFHDNVLPILRENCIRCHGDKAQGGLRLHSREHSLASGESEQPAVVPGNPDASQLIARIRDGDMPPTGEPLSDHQIETLEHWVQDGAKWPPRPILPEAIAYSAIVDNSSFLRRAYLDTIGVPPDVEDCKRFFSDTDPDKRQKLVLELLGDQQSADHWISFWLDILAENPTLLNASLNSTGPFRWFLYDSLRDGKPIDRMVTELILMRGSKGEGGSAGFALAGENDAPMAAKAHILSAAFLGVELQCARCHDSPYHSTTQEDLYSLAAMLNRKPLTPPKTSRVRDAFFENKGRESLIRVSLALGKQVDPKWPFADFTGVQDNEDIDSLMMRPEDSRERLAALITGPANQRFPRVIVNHVWKRLMGAGFVEPPNDWEGKSVSHPKLLDWLAHELITHDYDVKHIVQLVMTSQAYQREATGNNLGVSAEQRFFNAPDPRRLTAEQIVDSMHAATGRPMDVEELTFVHDGSHPIEKRMTLGVPRRAWMFASLNNERDRPSLSLPRAQPVVNVLEAFGWSGSRQKPIAMRDTAPNVLQPGILANGKLTMSLARATHESLLADLAVDSQSPESLLDTLFLRFLARFPEPQEKATLGRALSQGFEQRLAPPNQITTPPVDAPLPQVTWTNHLVPEANEIQLEVERRVRRGPPADTRLRNEWRSIYEDIVWSLINDREFVWMP